MSSVGRRTGSTLWVLLPHQVARGMLARWSQTRTGHALAQGAMLRRRPHLQGSRVGMQREHAPSTTTACPRPSSATCSCPASRTAARRRVRGAACPKTAAAAAPGACPFCVASRCCCCPCVHHVCEREGPPEGPLHIRAHHVQAAEGALPQPVLRTTDSSSWPVS